MTARRPLSPLETLLQSHSQLPWWLYLLLALISGLLLHWLSFRLLQGSTAVAGGTLLHGFTLVAQVLVPLALLLRRWLTVQSPVAPSTGQSAAAGSVSRPSATAA
ncbi:hypothetical protein ULG90_17785 [Halopseudomonas pachastrellae]|nr:hypothetical protein ULG90_17785 [Halopseudomonas pachastrellae]